MVNIFLVSGFGLMLYAANKFIPTGSVDRGHEGTPPFMTKSNLKCLNSILKNIAILVTFGLL